MRGLPVLLALLVGCGYSPEELQPSGVGPVQVLPAKAVEPTAPATFPVTIHYAYTDSGAPSTCHMGIVMTEASFAALGLAYPQCKVYRSPWGGEVDCLCHDARGCPPAPQPAGTSPTECNWAP